MTEECWSLRTEQRERGGQSVSPPFLRELTRSHRKETPQPVNLWLGGCALHLGKKDSGKYTLRIEQKSSGVDDRFILRCIGDRDRLCCSSPDNCASKILSNESQRKHGPAVDDLRDDTGIGSIDRSRHAIDGRETLPDPQNNGLGSKCHGYFMGDWIPCNCSTESFDDRTDGKECP